MTEENVFRTRNTRKAYFPVYLISAASLLIIIFFAAKGTFAPTIILAALFIVFTIVNITEIHRLGNLYEVLPHAVVHTNGYVSIESRRIDLNSVSDVIISQSLIQRLLNFGDIHIRLFSVEAQATLKNVDKPRDFAGLVEKRMAEIRRQQRNEDFRQPSTIEILE